MKAIFSFTHLPFKHLFGHLTIGFLLIGSMAQAQEAFYIYRNDGDFNGFFYDEVIEMRQSKIGVDSIEYDRWVTQEVVLADTTYRIPLAVIDSISFIQPEIIFNPQLRHMDLLEMTPYVTARDSQTLTFSNELPTSLMPQIGNVLIGFTGILEEGGFGGRVTNVTSSGNSIIVETDELTKMSDIFVKFITIEEVGVLEDDPDQVVYRMAGLNKIKQWSGAGNISLFNINANLHFPIDPGSGTAGGSLDATIYFKSKLAMVYKIDEDVFFIKAGVSQELGLESSLTLKLSGSPDLKPADLIKPAISFKFPATPPIPLFQIDPMPKVGVRCGGEFDMKINFPGISGSLSEVFTFDSDDPNLMSFKFTPKFNTTPIGDIIDFAANTDFEFKAEGFVQGGLMVECAIKTNQWVSKIFSASCGFDIWAGPKLNLAFDISGKALMSGDGPYTFADSYLGMNLLSLDAEAYSKGSFLGKAVKHTWLDGSIDVFPRLNFYFLNKFSNFQAEHSDNSHILRASWDMDLRNSLYSHQPGIAVYHKRYATPKIVYSDYTSIPTTVSEGDAINQHFDIEKRTVDWKAGQYFAAPSLNTSDGEHPVYSLEQSFYVPLYFKADKDTITLPTMGGSMEVSVSSNGNIKVKPDVPSPDDKVQVSVVNDSTVKISTELQNSSFYEDKELGYEYINIIDKEDSSEVGYIPILVEQKSDPTQYYNQLNVDGRFYRFVGNEVKPLLCTMQGGGNTYTISGSYSGTRTVNNVYKLVNYRSDGLVVWPDGNCQENISCSMTCTFNTLTGEASGHAQSTITDTYTTSGGMEGFNATYHVQYNFTGEFFVDEFERPTIRVLSISGPTTLSEPIDQEEIQSAPKQVDGWEIMYGKEYFYDPEQENPHSSWYYYRCNRINPDYFWGIGRDTE